MRKLAVALFAVLFLPAACAEPSAETAELFRAPPIPNEIDGVVFEAGNWEPYLPAGEAGVSWGNHRAVVVLEEGGVGSVDAETDDAVQDPGAVLATVPWRRRDANPASKGIIVVDAESGEAVRNVLVLRVDNESGDILFQPNPSSSTYHVYYLPWQSTGGYYPTITYPTQAELQASEATGVDRDIPSRADEGGQAAFSWAGQAPNPDPDWLAAARSVPPEELTRALTTHIQSVNDFHSFFPMEIVATREETESFMEGAPDGWRVVPEHRDYPVRMQHFIPWHWTRSGQLSGSRTASGTMANSEADVSAETSSGPQGVSDAGSFPPVFASRVLRNESFTFQLALVAGEAPLQDVHVVFTDFPTDWPEDALTCFNCGGIDEKGEAFTKRIDISPGTVQPLWIGIRIPPDQPPGPVAGTVTVATANRGSKSVQVSLEVQPGTARDGGEDTPELMTRLAWLNSTVGTDPDFIIEPFEPVRVEETNLSILGREVELAESGLPAQIWSYFSPELTHFSDDPEPILVRPIELRVVVRGEPEPFRWTPPAPVQASAGRAEWTAAGTSDRFAMTVTGALEYDGMLDYRITLVASEDVEVEDIALPVSYDFGAAEYMLGLGRKGGRRPSFVDWKWAVENHQEGVWLGGVNRGLQYVLRDDNYVRPLNTNFYRNQPLNLPPSWFNGGRGGIRILEEGGADGATDPAMASPAAGRQVERGGDPGPQPLAITATNYSGPRTLSAGDTLHFNVRFLITPFKPIDTETHFNTRFVHQYVPVDSVVVWGGTVVNIHHANEINPYINYPFFHLDLQKAYVDEAHGKGVKVKLYNTIRELTYRAWELFALRSLGNEILNDGEGGGHSWMQEHLQDHYHSAWHAWRVDDAAMLDKGTSRWTNYYIEGNRWLAQNQEIDGLYLDDIAFSRATVKRLVNVLHANRPQVVIDLHSANQFNVRDGFTNSAMLYMEHFPFINRLWFGEYFEYDLDPDYWMTEVSGLPFGLMGEMLQDGGRPYRGMLYGMTARKYGDVDPRPVWEMMSDFGIAESRMLGYWLEDAPVRTDRPDILATTYARDDRILIALASWADRDEVVSLDVDWDRLGPGGGGASPTITRSYAPGVEGLQDEAEVDISALRVPAAMGLWIIIDCNGCSASLVRPGGR